MLTEWVSMGSGTFASFSAGSPISTRLKPEHRFHNYVVRRVSPRSLGGETVLLKHGEWERIDATNEELSCPATTLSSYGLPTS